MNIIKSLSTASCLLFGILSGTSVASEYDDHRSKGALIQGHVTHGINVFNNQAIADYTQVSPTVPFLNPSNPVKEIGVFNEDAGATDANVITQATDNSKPVATISSFTQFFGLTGLVDPTSFNKTIDQVGSNFFGSTNPKDRTTILNYEDAFEGSYYARKGVNSKPTVKDWNAIRGALYYSCKSNGSATVEISIKNAIPNSLYTTWDVGVSKPLTSEETGYAVPFGGVPNTIITNSKGCGHAKFKVPFCPERPCEAGAATCTSFVSAVYHFDDQVYGASPAASIMGLPAGTIAANHISWNITGTSLLPAQSKLKRKTLSCDD